MLWYDIVTPTRLLITPLLFFHYPFLMYRAQLAGCALYAFMRKKPGRTKVQSGLSGHSDSAVLSEIKCFACPAYSQRSYLVPLSSSMQDAHTL